LTPTNKLFITKLQLKEIEMKKDAKKEQPFRNVALLPDDHQKLKELADLDQRTMTRQLSVIIRREFQTLLKSMK
tara:strand:- start:1048 stop:1269 length:222 start_codon:yes stop_codon:yes gene_type:complete